MNAFNEWINRMRGTAEPEDATGEPGTERELRDSLEGGADQPGEPRPSDPAPQVDPDTLHERVIDALREIYDPEIPVKIYDLGLIYEVEISATSEVDVQMTLTTPGCPVAATFPGMVEAAVANVDGVRDARVELVWDPPWTMDRMPEEVKLELGLL